MLQRDLDLLLRAHDASKPPLVFANENLQGLTFYGDLRRCDFRGADLRHATIHNCDLRQCDFRGANLLDASIDQCIWEQALGLPWVDETLPLKLAALLATNRKMLETQWPGPNDQVRSAIFHWTFNLTPGGFLLADRVGDLTALQLLLPSLSGLAYVAPRFVQLELQRVMSANLVDCLKLGLATAYETASRIDELIDTVTRLVSATVGELEREAKLKAQLKPAETPIDLAGGSVTICGECHEPTPCTGDCNAAAQASPVDVEPKGKGVGHVA